MGVEVHLIFKCLILLVRVVMSTNSHECGNCHYYAHCEAVEAAW